MVILEVVTMHIHKGTSNDFESSFRKAAGILSGMPGFVGQELHKCVEEADKYILLVQWDSITDDIVGFRQSEAYQEWKTLLEPYFETFPVSEHYVNIKL